MEEEKGQRGQKVPRSKGLKVQGSQGPRVSRSRDSKAQGSKGPRYLKLTFKYELDSKESPTCLPINLICVKLQGFSRITRYFISVLMKQSIDTFLLYLQ